MIWMCSGRETFDVQHTDRNGTDECGGGRRLKRLPSVLRALFWCRRRKRVDCGWNFQSQAKRTRRWQVIRTTLYSPILPPQHHQQ